MNPKPLERTTTTAEATAERLIRKYASRLGDKAAVDVASDLASALAQAEAQGYERGAMAMQKECLEWCMAYRRDDGTSQMIEAKIRSLTPASLGEIKP